MSRGGSATSSRSPAGRQTAARRSGSAERPLDTLTDPAALKTLPERDLPRLAQEIREKIIATVARTGGHLAPNLGVVELTIALHRVFDSPRDRIIWDVGHQAYTHKILTGRLDRFDTLRQDGGLSGFPRRTESPHDVYETGHASTSISAGLGMAKARDLKGERYSVVAVIGDGALTGGLAFEALNNAGHMGTDLIVILNDNEFSYARTVGGLASHLSRLRTHPAYFRAKRDIESILNRVPLVGAGLARLGERLKDSLKYMVVPGVLFEELGFTYIGPVDGHNIAALEEFLGRAKRTDGPVFVHVLTKKGKGYAPAEADPDRFHGTGPFDVATGTALRPAAPATSGVAGAGAARRLNNGPSTSVNGHQEPNPTYTEVFGEALLKLGRQDNRIVAITAAMASSTGVVPFSREFPRRWFDVGICEQHAVTFASGLAREGLRPVVAVYSTFLQRAYDQILHDVCLQDLPVTFALDRAGLVGADGPTHHGVYDFAYLRSMPGMTVMAPRDENELGHMLKTAIYLGRPAAVRYPRGTGVGVPLDAEFRALPVGEGVVLREGRDVAIVAIGSMVEPSLEAADVLASRGIHAAVVNARFVAPLDRDLILRLAREVGALVTVEEHVSKGGFGGAVAELLVDEAGALGSAGVELRRLSLPDEPVEHGKVEVLLARFGLDPVGIARAAGEVAREVAARRGRGAAR